LPITEEKAIWLDEIILANTEATVIPYDPAKTAAEGKCKYTIKRAVPPWGPTGWIENGVDLFTQYPFPWGGQGLANASDAFPPQGLVELHALVTFRFDPVAYKPVSYELTAPSGTKHYATVSTIADGIATFDYSLPSSEFGLWAVKASVDLGGHVYSDTLWFLEGWLVEVVNVEAPKPVYDQLYNNETLPGFVKGATVGVSVTLVRICWQDPRDMMDMILKSPQGEPITGNDLLLHMTVTDELKQPVGIYTLSTSQITELMITSEGLKEFVIAVGENWDIKKEFIQDNYSSLVFTVVNGIPISASAFSGVATIHANVLTDYPGVAYCPERTESIWLRK
jgi:hypothetical protein